MNSKNIIVTITVIINSTMINIISLFFILVVTGIYKSRCYVALDIYFLTSLLLYIFIKLGSS